ncbi:MAG: Chorismate dehydratase [Verrucomicrobia subdivision 3 bacterium]|nr:Chorismate dehydratase [Limisphaerales bacterium]MCS1414678.1 Chorismate dehydratase [Limisphaerales bacterium]
MRNGGTSLPSKGPRIGSVPYLNSVPLTWGLEQEIMFLPPSQLSESMRQGNLDAALLSITEALFGRHYLILDGIGVCSAGPVNSVFLAHRGALADIIEVHCDPASLTSVNLLRVLLHRRNIHPKWSILDSYDAAAEEENVLLIGNPAIHFRQQNHPHQLWDLGEAWQEDTHLPFVFAVWVLKKGIDYNTILPQLQEARDQGVQNIETIVRSYGEFDEAFRRKYLTQAIRYNLGVDERRGIAKFVTELRQFPDLTVYEPEFLR